MQTARVIKPFDVVGCSLNNVLMGFVLGLIDLLGFEAFEETFHVCVAVAVAFSAHAWQQSMSFESVLIGQAGELGATIKPSVGSRNAIV